METIVVGIDVSKGKRDIAVRPCGEVFSTSRDAQGLDALIARLAPLSPAAVAVEATGGFETVVAASKAPRGGGRSSAVKRLRRVACRCGESGPGPFLRAGLGQAGQDRSDRRAAIAHFAEAAKPEIRPLPDEAARLLSDLVARRRQIIQMIVAERQRQRRLVEKRLRKSVARLRKALQKEFFARDQSIDEDLARAGLAP